MKLDQYKEKLRRHLDEELYRHSLGAAATAADLACRYGADPERAYLAGLLHDYGKGYSYSQLREKGRQLGVPLDRISLEQPKLLHAPVGAALLPVELAVADPAVIRAVALHTTGSGTMTLLDKTVYLADFLEPNRDFPGVERLRRLAAQGLAQALLAAVDHTIASILERRMLLHPRTVQFRNSLLSAALSQENGG